MTNNNNYFKLIKKETIINLNKINYIQKNPLSGYLDKTEVWFDNGQKINISYQDYLDLIKEIDFL